MEQLRAGNRRFVARAGGWRVDPARGQEPSAVVLCCSDSRVPPEIVFDCGPGELFVVRVAGNIAAPSQVASVEFAVEQFGTPLVVVLGHTACGAVAATLSGALGGAEEEPLDTLSSILERIRPAVDGVLADVEDPHAEDLLARAVRANILATVEALRRGSPVLAARVRDKGLVVVGAEYCLESGEVEFLG